MLGSILGILVFLGGVGLLGWTFQLAYTFFSVPPTDALGLAGAKALDPAKAGNSVTALLIRILLLFVMAFVGSMVANRGIAMYTACRARKHD